MTLVKRLREFTGTFSGSHFQRFTTSLHSETFLIRVCAAFGRRIASNYAKQPNAAGPSPHFSLAYGVTHGSSAGLVARARSVSDAWSEVKSAG